MVTFNLVDEPWIPCVTADGASIELGLLDTLTRAHELREMADPSPLVTVALHRLLLAIVHRLLDGPASYDAWCAVWNAGQFDSAQPVLEAVAAAGRPIRTVDSAARGSSHTTTDPRSG